MTGTPASRTACRDVLVARDQAFPAVGDEDQQFGLGERPAPARDDQFVERVLAGAEHPAGVGQLEADLVGHDRVGDDVAGRPGDGRHDRAARPRHPIEQRGLTHIGASDQHDGREARGSHGCVSSVAPLGSFLPRRALVGSRVRAGDGFAD
jgi:hypothetical protein